MTASNDSTDRKHTPNMSNGSDWRAISPDELRVAATIVRGSGIAAADELMRDLDGAQVRNETEWILDVRAGDAGRGADLADGPLPVRAYVPDLRRYQGEIIVWVTDGHVSGLEYAWVTDNPPAGWPHPDTIQIIPDSAASP
jgi:hypothetical protein